MWAVGRCDVAPRQAEALRAALPALWGTQLSALLTSSPGEPPAGAFRQLRLSLVGNDRRSIVGEVSQALSARAISVREMDTSITSAPMSGEPLFEAVAHIRVPQALDLDELKHRLDAIAEALTVEIDLEESLR